MVPIMAKTRHWRGGRKHGTALPKRTGLQQSRELFMFTRWNEGIKV